MDTNLYFPLLTLKKEKKQTRQFSLYTEEQKAQVIYYWLFEGSSQRKMDHEILKLDGKETHGYQSMGILHYLGLTKDHKKVFANKSILESLQCLSKYLTNSSISEIYYYLEKFYNFKYLSEEKKILSLGTTSNNLINYDRYIEISKEWIKNTLSKLEKDESSINEILRLINPTKNKTLINNTIYYYSNQTAKEALKSLYNYNCQICGSTILKKGWKYDLTRIESWKFKTIDVHHINPLSKGGKDSYENMICVCPNCHHKFHSDEYKLKKTPLQELICIDVILYKEQKVKNIKHSISLDN